MPLTISEIQGKLRRGVGNPSTTTLSETQILDAIASAVKEYSKGRPIEVLDYLTTEGEKSDYTLSSKTRIMDVKDVYYSTAVSYVFDEYFPDAPNLGRLEGISIFDNPSIWTQYIQRLEQYQRIFDGDFIFNQAAKILTLIPAPTNSGNRVYYVWKQMHEVGETRVTVPEDDIETFLLWAKAECKEMMAGKRGEQIQSVSGYGESVSLGSSSKDLNEEAENLRGRFNKKMCGSTIVVG